MPTKRCTWLGWWWANLRLQSVAQMIKESPLINRTSITTAVKSFFVCVKQSDRKCTWLFATSHRMDHLAFPICQIVFGYRLNRCVRTQIPGCIHCALWANLLNLQSLQLRHTQYWLVGCALPHNFSRPCVCVTLRRWGHHSITASLSPFEQSETSFGATAYSSVSVHERAAECRSAVYCKLVR